MPLTLTSPVTGDEVRLSDIACAGPISFDSQHIEPVDLGARPDPPDDCVVVSGDVLGMAVPSNVGVIEPETRDPAVDQAQEIVITALDDLAEAALALARNRQVRVRISVENHDLNLTALNFVAGLAEGSGARVRAEGDGSATLELSRDVTSPADRASSIGWHNAVVGNAAELRGIGVAARIGQPIGVDLTANDPADHVAVLSFLSGVAAGAQREMKVMDHRITIV